MSDQFLYTDEAARRLGISRATLYEWISCSNRGKFTLHGQPVIIDHFRTGAKGQGPIRFEVEEIERLRGMMRVRPRPGRERRPPTKQHHYPGIRVELGNPDD